MKALEPDIVEKAVSLYVNDKLTAKEVSEALGIGLCTVLRLVRRNGHETRTTKEQIIGKILPKIVSDEEVAQLYLSGKSSYDIAITFGCSNVTVLNSLRRSKITIRKPADHIKVKFDEELAYKLYMEGRTLEEVAKIMNVKRQTLQSRLKNKTTIRRSWFYRNGKKWNPLQFEKFRNTRRQKREQGLHDHIYLRRTGYTYAEFMKQLPKWKAYREQVRSITNQQPIHALENYEKRGKAGINGAYQIDHRYSVIEGFKNGIDPNIIGHITNLQMLPWRDNLKKKGSCSISLEELTSLQRAA